MTEKFGPLNHFIGDEKMTELKTPEPQDNDDDSLEEAGEPEKIIQELAALSPLTILNEAAVAKLFGRHRASVRRAVERKELPAPARLFGGPFWTVGVIQKHLEGRLEEARKEADRLAKINS